MPNVSLRSKYATVSYRAGSPDLDGFGPVPVSITISSSIYTFSDEAREQLLPSINLEGDRERRYRYELNYVISAICYSLFATYTITANCITIGGPGKKNMYSGVIISMSVM